MDHPTDQLMKEPLLSPSEDLEAGGRSLEEQDIATLTCSAESPSLAEGKRRHLAKKEQTATVPNDLPARSSKAIPFDIIRLLVAIGQLVGPVFISVLPIDYYFVGSPDVAIILYPCMMVAGNMSLLVLLRTKYYEYQQIEHGDIESGDTDADASSGKLHYKNSLHLIDAAPTVFWMGYGIALFYDDSDRWSVFCLLFGVILFVYLFYTFVFRKGSPVRRLFQQMEDEHFDHLRDTAHERESKLQKQIQQMAHLEEMAATRRAQSSNMGTGSAFLRDNCSLKQQGLALGLLVAVIWVGFQTYRLNAFLLCPVPFVEK